LTVNNHKQKTEGANISVITECYIGEKIRSERFSKGQGEVEAVIGMFADD
jgi:hypothetical protein